MKRVVLLIAALALAASGLIFWVPAAATASTGIVLWADEPYGPYTCKPGNVWREAFPGDFVCVPHNAGLDHREKTAAENRAAAANRDPNGGPYGPDDCKTGFVWREARPSDHVCVRPASRAINKRYNRDAVFGYKYPPGLPKRGANSGNIDFYNPPSGKWVSGTGFTPKGEVSLYLYAEDGYGYSRNPVGSWKADSQGNLRPVVWSKVKCESFGQVHLTLVDERTGRVSNAGRTKKPCL